jgi:hypothetical protein
VSIALACFAGNVSIALACFAGNDLILNLVLTTLVPLIALFKNIVSSSLSFLLLVISISCLSNLISCF